MYTSPFLRLSKAARRALSEAFGSEVARGAYDVVFGMLERSPVSPNTPNRHFKDYYRSLR